MMAELLKYEEILDALKSAAKGKATRIDRLLYKL